MIPTSVKGSPWELPADMTEAYRFGSPLIESAYSAERRFLRAARGEHSEFPPRSRPRRAPAQRISSVPVQEPASPVSVDSSFALGIARMEVSGVDGMGPPTKFLDNDEWLLMADRHASAQEDLDFQRRILGKELSNCLQEPALPKGLPLLFLPQMRPPSLRRILRATR